MNLTGPQIRALEQYARIGLTTQAICRSRTLDVLVRKGLVRRSYGLGPIEAEITDAGWKALGFRQPDA